MKKRLGFAIVCVLLTTLMPSVGERQADDHTPFSPSATLGKSAGGKTFRALQTLDKPLSATGANVQAADPKLPLDDTQPTSAQLWQQLAMLLNQTEFQQIPILTALLAEQLRKQPDSVVHRQINEWLSQPDISLAIKAILLDLLAETATLESLDQLLSMTEQEIDPSLYVLVVQAISRIGDNRWNGQFHEELSPTLEAVWTNPNNNDPVFLDAIGKAIADVGAPQGVEQLLKTVSGDDQTKGTQTTLRIKQEVAFKAIPQVRNPAAIDVLAVHLAQEPLGAPALEVSGTALAAIGTSAAAQTLLDWAKTAPPEGTRNLQDWLAKIDNERALASIYAAQNQAFKSPEIAAIINATATKTATDTLLSASTELPNKNTHFHPKHGMGINPQAFSKP